MAVVFVSSKQRQKMFFIIITAVFLLFLAIIFFWVFLYKPQEVSPELVFNKPKVSIDMAIFDSDEFKNLQIFPEMETQYSYIAFTEDRNQKTGFISAASEDQANTILESMGLTVQELKEVEIGRDNPFISYYQLVTTPVTGAKIPTKTK